MKCLFITSHTSVLIQLLFLDASLVTNEESTDGTHVFSKVGRNAENNKQWLNGGSIREYDVTHANVITKRKNRWLKHLDTMRRRLIRKLLGS